jgi:hypothetical protein
MMMRAMWSCGLALSWAASGCGADPSLGTSSPPIAPAFAGSSGGSQPDAGPRGPLPAAFKGYELYAWDQSSGLEFTLITGTNRQKTAAEITPRQQEQTDGEFVSVSGSGLPALEQVLERVPAATSVLLSEIPGLPPLSESSRDAIVRLLDR